MITFKFLEKCGFKIEDIPQILTYDKKHGEKIGIAAKEFMDGRKLKPLISYTDDELMESYEYAVGFLKKAEELFEEPDTLSMRNLIFWIRCLPLLKAEYETHHLSEDVFFETVRDIAYKVEEHKKRYGELGLLEPWVCLVFDIRLFAFGRLQYQLGYFDEEEYCCGDYRLKKGDKVYACHIPSNGPLTGELCMDSFQRAYDFFKDELKNDIIPIVTRSYLIYPPYCDSVFVKGSNIYGFIKMFDVIAQKETEVFGDCWRIFNKDYDDSTADFPVNTGLQRRFVEYINNDGNFGTGYGIILYDGKNKRIINTASDTKCGNMV